MKKKLIIYISITLIFGLSQIWLTSFILFLTKVNFTIIDIVKDGGLFFFSSSFAVSSFFNHRKVFNKVKNDEIIWSLSFILIISMLCAAGYATALNTQGNKFSFETNDRQNWLQVCCTILSIAYGVLTEFRLEKFMSKTTIPQQ